MCDLSDQQISTMDSLKAIANRHGVDIDRVRPSTQAGRLDQLRRTLSTEDVPFRISEKNAAEYFLRAKAGDPFTIGSLGENTVDLAEYANEQVYENYTQEEHLSWACLIAEQQRSKSKFACSEYLSGEELFQIGGQVIPISMT